MFLLSISSTSYLHWYLWLLAQWISNTETEWRYCKKILSVVVILFIDGIRQFLMAVPLVPVSFIWGRSFVGIVTVCCLQLSVGACPVKVLSDSHWTCAARCRVRVSQARCCGSRKLRVEFSVFGLHYLCSRFVCLRFFGIWFLFKLKTQFF